MISRPTYYFLPLLLWLFVACTPSRDPGIVVVHFLNEPPSLHPVTESNSYTSQVNSLCHQMLMLVDTKTGKLMPELAATMPTTSADKLSYRYQIQEGAAWPDGKAITAEDVLFSYKLLVCPLIEAGQRAAGMDVVSDMRTDPNDPRQVEMLFSEFSLSNAFMGAATFVLDPRQYDPEGQLARYSFNDLKMADSTLSQDTLLADWAADFNDVQTGMDLEKLALGSGPYVVSEWIPEQQIILTRRDNFWAKGRPEDTFHQGPSKIIFKVIKDDKLAELQFKQQELDVSYMMTNKTYEELQASEAVKAAYQLTAVPRNNYAFIALNNNADGDQHPRFFQDKELRRALTFALPIDQIIEEVFPGVAERSMSPIPSYHPDHNPNITPIPYDVEEANRLFEAAGWVDTDGDRIRDKVVNGIRQPLSFSMLYPPNGQDLITIAERIEEEWRKAGVDCKLVQQPFGELVPKLFGGDYDAVMLALATPPVPYDFTQIFWSQAERNFLGYTNVEADALMLQANRMTDEVERKKVMDRIQEMLYDDQPCIFFFSATRKIAIHRRFGDVKAYANDPFVPINTLEVDGSWDWDGEKWAQK